MTTRTHPGGHDADVGDHNGPIWVPTMLRSTCPRWAETRTYGEHLAHVHEIGWLVWTGTRWKADSGEYLIQRYAKLIVRGMLAEAERMADASDDDGDSGEASFASIFSSQVASLRQWALRCDSRAALKEMADLAKEVVIRDGNEFDAHPLVFNVINGTLDLKTGELRPHDPADLITQIAPVTYDPAATAPTWERFVSEIMTGRQDLVDFLRRFVGYCLTGSIKAQSFCILYGHGENGKSTFLETLRALFGPEYARQCPASTLMQKKDTGGPSSDIARMRGARLVSAVEPEKGARLAEGIIKAMTGGDTQTARFMYKEFFEMVTTHKVLLATNHKPRVSGTGHAIWRRIHLVPFDATFAGRADKDMPTKLRAELPGILNWALLGCREWLERGLDPPREVLAATAAYRRDEDRLADFWADCCVFTQEARVPCGDLYDAYRRWSESAGEKPMTLKTFGLAVAERGIPKPKFDRIAGKVVKVYLGVGLATGATGATGRPEVEFPTQRDNTTTTESAPTFETSAKPVAPVAPVAPVTESPELVARLRVVAPVLPDGDGYSARDEEGNVLLAWTWHEMRRKNPRFALMMPDGRVVEEEEPEPPDFRHLGVDSVDLDSSEQIAKLVQQSGGLMPSGETRGRDIPVVFLRKDGISLDKLSQGIAEAQGRDQQEVADRILDALNNRHHIYRVDPADPGNDLEN